MARLERGQFGRRIQRLIEQGVVIRCGNCGRQMQTPWGPRGHLIYDDGSGRCFESDGICAWHEELTPGHYTQTRFGVSLNWAEAQIQPLSHGETESSSIEREEDSHE